MFLIVLLHLLSILGEALILLPTYGNSVNTQQLRNSNVREMLFRCACCCKQLLLHPLTLAAFFSTVALATAVAFYGINNRNAFGMPALTSSFLSDHERFPIFSDGVQTLHDIGAKITTEVGCL